MRVLLTGHDGYIGAVMIPLLEEREHEVVGFDSCLFEGCDFGVHSGQVEYLRKDLRDVETADLEGMDAVIHLAAISNDPVGNLNPECTYAINHRASVQLARCAKEAGVERYIYSSSCSIYGAASQDDLLDESAPFNPVTAYGESKIMVEQDVSKLADDTFSPTYMRNATAYGVSSKLRTDLVVNSLVGYACTTGRVLLKSDGTPWRPLVHIEDISRAFIAVLEAPREKIHNEAFNIGSTEQNYRILEIAETVRDVVPGSEIAFDEGAGPDARCYRVKFTKFEEAFPEARPKWNVRTAAESLRVAYEANGITLEEFESSRYLRLRHIGELQASGKLTADLRMVSKH